MAFVTGGSESIFSQETYKSFVEKKNSIHNERLRGDDETIFDAAISKDADFTKHPEGKKIVDIIRNYK